MSLYYTLPYGEENWAKKSKRLIEEELNGLKKQDVKE